MTLVCDYELGAREYRAIQSLIYDLSGIALSDNKQIMVKGRLSKRLRSLELDSYKEYLEYLTGPNSEDEQTHFINALTTNKTSFFREQHHFDFLRETALPAIVERAKSSGNRKLRIWCSASSTGEEPYSIAMEVLDFFGANSGWDIRILASDIDTQVLSDAAEGIYDQDNAEQIPRKRLLSYFERIGDRDAPQWQAKADIKDLITYRQINLLEGLWPINTYFDIIFCRNVMIYFDSATQKQLVEKFSEKLHPAGHLVIGHSESLFGLTNSFKPIGDTVYQHAAQPTPVANQPQRTSSKLPTSTSLPTITATATCTAETKGSKRNSPGHNAIKKSTNTAEIVNQSLGDTPRHPIIVGEVHASREPVWISTLLGSCLAVCLYDEAEGIGGMNHFLLPSSNHRTTMTSNLGVHAMELLINEIMKLGGDRRRLKAKLFGGAAVVNNTSARWNIGEKNIEFAKTFLATENIPVVKSHTGGKQGMHVYFHSQNAKVFVRLLDRSTSESVQAEQKRQSESIVAEMSKSSEVTLF